MGRKIIVSWFNPTTGETGEFTTRDARNAHRFADSRRKAGLIIEIM